MARLEVFIDASMILKAIRSATDDIFISLYEFDDLESELNELGITLQEDEE